MDSERKKILEKLAEGKITLEKAWTTLDAWNDHTNSKKCSRTVSKNYNKEFLTIRLF